MQLVTFLAVPFIISSAVVALPPQYPPGHSPSPGQGRGPPEYLPGRGPPEYPPGRGPSPVQGGDKPGQSVAHQPWHRRVEVREAEPEPMPAAMPVALPEAAPEAAPLPLPDAEFIPTLVQRSPASEGESHSNGHSKVPPGYGPGPAHGPAESVSHKPWKRPLPEKANGKHDDTELVERQDHAIEARDTDAEDDEKHKEEHKPKPSPTKKDKWPPGYGGFPVGPTESVSHKPWHRHVERDAMPQPEPQMIPVSDFSDEVVLDAAASLDVKRDAMPEAQPEPIADAKSDLSIGLDRPVVA